MEKENMSAERSKSSEIIILSKDSIRKILRARKKLESKLKISIETRKDSLEIKGDEVDLFAAKNVLEAVEKKFNMVIALLLADPEYTIEDIPIKTETRKKNLERIRGRVIGREGRTLELISELSNCYLSLHDNTVSIIGTFDKMKDAIIAVKSIIHGSKQANVYNYLEKARTRPLNPKL